MKLNKIFMALAAMAIVGCSSDDLNEFSAKQAVKDSRLVELNPNFVLAGVGEESNVTRTHWEQDEETGGLVNKFLPIYATAPSGSTLDDYVDFEGTTNYPAEAVGLCWLGQASGAEVYTNYQFFHFGWLNKGESEADVDNCDPFNLYNGSLYSEITADNSAAAAGDEADPETDFSSIPAKSLDGLGKDNLNYNSGVYKTENKTIFGGDYIVYYPYNADFQETGAIPAVATTSFEWDITADPLTPWENPKLGKTTFRYSNPVHIDGGMNAANFSMTNLSTLVRLRVFTGTAMDAYNGADIDKVVLLSESGQFVKEAKLGADKIAAGKKGQELYTGKPEGTKTVTTVFTGTLPQLDVKKKTEVSAYFTVLPTTVDDLVALVHATKGTESFWYRVEMDPIEFKAGGAKVVDVLVKEANITSDYVVVDDQSLRDAITEAEAEGTECTITLIGDITLTADLNINQPEDRLITIDGGDIIVPQDVELTIETLKEMKSTVRVLGAECCNTSSVPGGILTVTGSDAKDATILHNIILEETEARYTTASDYDYLNPKLNYNGAATITIADDATVTVKGGNVNVSREVAHKGAIVIGENKDKKDNLFGAKVNVDAGGNLKFMGAASKVTNNGIIEVKASGQFNMTDANNNATWNEGKRMKNYGKFIHNVGAGVGTAVQAMNNYGEYRCKVNDQVTLDNAYKQWTACNVIEMVNSSTYPYDLKKACQHTVKDASGNDKNIYIDIEVNSGDVTTFNNPSTGDNEDIEIGNLTVLAGGLYVDLSVDKDHMRSLTVHGDMTVKEDVTINSSESIVIDKNLTITEAIFDYEGGYIDTGVLNNGGLTVGENITVIGDGVPVVAPKDPTDPDEYTALFDARDDDALNITCKNFYLKEAAAAVFGNQTSGEDHSLTVSGSKPNGTISNPKGCLFDILPLSSGTVIAWVTCITLQSGGLYDASEPLVVE